MREASRAVAAHVNRAMIKLNARARAQLVVGAFEAGLVTASARSHQNWSPDVSMVTKKKTPVTRSDLVRDLHAIGVEQGQVLMLHASLSSIGSVIGGADSVVLALQEVLGDQGT